MSIAKATSKATSFGFLDASSMIQLSKTNKKWNSEMPEIVKNLLPRIICDGPIRNADYMVDEVPSYDFERAYQITNDLGGRPIVSMLSSFLFENPNYNLNSAGRIGWTVLAIAIDKRSLLLVKNILDRDPSLVHKGREEGGNRRSYLAFAARGGTLAIVREFVNRRANINRCASENGETALHATSLVKGIAITKYLLLQGAILYQEPRARALSLDYLSEDCRKDLKDQPLFIYKVINQMINQMRRERPLLFSAYAKLFSKLPKDVALSILDYSERYCLHGKFIERL